MDELISRDWVLKNLLFDVDRDVVRKAPKVDAVEVVRCKDCKHYNEGFCVGYHAHHDTMPDDFCSYGERKDDDGNG